MRTLTFILFIASLPFYLLFSVTPTDDAPNGKIEMVISINGMSLPFFAGMYVLFDRNYLLEKTPRQEPVRNPQTGEIIVQMTDTTTYYYLTDLETKKVTQLKQSGSSWNVVSRYPLNKKQFGYQLSPEMPEIAGYAERFRYIGDTTIENKLCKILIDTAQRPNTSGNKQGVVKQSIVYLQSQRKGIPISISKILDEKFGGWSYKMDMTVETVDENVKQSVYVSATLNLTEGLGKEQLKLISDLKKFQ